MTILKIPRSLLRGGSFGVSVLVAVYPNAALKDVKRSSVKNLFIARQFEDVLSQNGCR